MRSRIPYIIILIFGLCSSVYTYAQSQDTEKKILALMDNYRFAEAIELADISLASDTANSTLLLLKSRAMTALFQYKQSFEVLLKAYAADMANLQIIAELSSLYQKKGDNENAIYYAGKACQLNPYNAYFILQLAGLYFADADYTKSIDLLRPLTTGTTLNLYAMRLTADCYYEMKQNDSSEYWYQKILTASPFDTYATQKLSNIYIRTVKYEKGLRLTEDYLEHDTLPNPVMKQHAWFHHLLKDYKTAVSGFRKCLRSGDSSLFVFSKLGLSYYKQEIFDSSELYFRQAWALDTTDAETCFYYGVSASRSFLADTGILYLNKALSLLMPSEQFITSIYVELAEAYNNKRDYKKALDVLAKIQSIYPENKRLYFRLAYQWDYFFYNYDKALEYYTIFMKDMPEVIPEAQNGTQTTYETYARKRISELNKRKAQQK